MGSPRPRQRCNCANCGRETTCPGSWHKAYIQQKAFCHECMTHGFTSHNEQLDRSALPPDASAAFDDPDDSIEEI